MGEEVDDEAALTDWMATTRTVQRREKTNGRTSAGAGRFVVWRSFWERVFEWVVGGVVDMVFFWGGVELWSVVFLGGERVEFFIFVVGRGSERDFLLESVED